MNPNVKIIHVLANARMHLTLGDAIAEALTDELRFQWRVVAVIPIIMALYADMPRRYEVREADIILEKK